MSEAEDAERARSIGKALRRGDLLVETARLACGVAGHLASQPGYHRRERDAHGFGVPGPNLELIARDAVAIVRAVIAEAER